MTASKAPKCAACGARCQNAGDGEHWVCTRKSCGSEWNADHGPEYAMDDELGARTVEETTVVRLGTRPGEQFGFECATCQTVSGLQFGNEQDAATALSRHQADGCAP